MTGQPRPYPLPVTTVAITRLPFHDPVARELLDAAMADLAARYGGGGDGTSIDPVEFEPPRGAFLVARVGGTPAGCGGWRTLLADPDTAEIKRVYTVPAFRGRGVASAVLRAIEESARNAGRARIALETGEKQPEAIAFYQKLGYARIADFGYYKDYPGVRSFGRDL